MTYIEVSVKDKFDSWFDSYIIDHGGQVFWNQFYVDLCACYDGIGPLDVVIVFNRLKQWADVTSYQKRFEDLCCRVQVVRSHFDGLYFIIISWGASKRRLTH